jgi:hypothetical protein
MSRPAPCSIPNTPTTDGKRRDGVAAAHTNAEGEIARAEDDYRTDWLEHAAHVRLGGRLTVRVRMIDAGIDPGSFADERREQPCLVDHPRPLRGQPRHGERRFGVGLFKERVAEGHPLVGNRLEERRAPIDSYHAVLLECRVGRSHGLVNLGRRRLVDGWRGGFTRRRIAPEEGRRTLGDESTANDLLAVKRHGKPPR